jgi:pimeloyl-ACP methyl ester carboxylesterase
VKGSEHEWVQGKGQCGVGSRRLADGSSWNAVIGPLLSKGLNVLAAPIPLTSLPDDVAALNRALERTDGPVVLVAHAYAGAVIASTTKERIRSLVFIAALAPDEGETVADVFYREKPHPEAPDWRSTRMASFGCHGRDSAPLSFNMLLPNGLRFLLRPSGQSLSRAYRRRLRDPLGK